MCIVVSGSELTFQMGIIRHKKKKHWDVDPRGDDNYINSL